MLQPYMQNVMMKKAKRQEIEIKSQGYGRDSPCQFLGRIHGAKL